MKQAHAQVYIPSGGSWAPKTAGVVNLTLYNNASARTYRVVALEGASVSCFTWRLE